MPVIDEMVGYVGGGGLSLPPEPPSVLPPGAAVWVGVGVTVGAIVGVGVTDAIIISAF